jgi:hypothetical protein
MKVKDLKKLLESAPDDLEVVVSGSDHSYNRVGRGSKVVKAELFPKQKHLSQYWDDANKSEPSNPVVEVFWIDDGNY